VVKPSVFKFLFLSWMVFVTFFSLFSLDGIHTSSFDIPHIDKLVHFTFYFGMVVLGFFAIRKKKNQWSRKQVVNSLNKVLTFAIIYGIIIEVIQHVFTVNRNGDILDAFANSVGALLGMFLIRVLFLKKQSLK